MRNIREIFGIILGVVSFILVGCVPPLVIAIASLSLAHTASHFVCGIVSSFLVGLFSFYVGMRLCGFCVDKIAYGNS
jgi:hypothetical protein